MTPWCRPSRRVPLTVLQEPCTILPRLPGRALGKNRGWWCWDCRAPSPYLLHPRAHPHPFASASPCRVVWLRQGLPVGPCVVPDPGMCPWGPCPTVGTVSRDATCPGRWGAGGTGACSLPVLPVPTPLPAFLPGCSFSEFLGRAATANSLFLAGVICTRWLCRVPTAGLRGVRCPLGTLLPAAAAPSAPTSGGLAGSCGHPGSALRCPQVPARVGGDAQSHRGEGAGASGGGPRCSGER